MCVCGDWDTLLTHTLPLPLLPPSPLPQVPYTYLEEPPPPPRVTHPPPGAGTPLQLGRSTSGMYRPGMEGGGAPNSSSPGRPGGPPGAGLALGSVRLSSLSSPAGMMAELGISLPDDLDDVFGACLLGEGGGGGISAGSPGRTVS